MIRQIELEITTSCNAACPQCSRNFYGGAKWPTVPDVSVSLAWLQQKFPTEFLKNLEVIRFCGTYGDPCVHPDLIDIVAWLKSISSARIFINTNGGMRSLRWWRDLAAVLDVRDEVIFGIDGLKSTNHIYRRGVDFDRVIKNLKSFVNNGGSATWQFLVFAHNEHQVEEAEKISRELGCRNFLIKKTTRFVNKKHQRIQKSPVIDKHKIYFVELPKNPDLRNEGYEQFEPSKDWYLKSDIDCIAKRLEMIYVGADGYVFPCGFLADRLYGFEVENHPDHDRLISLFRISGGAHTANLHFTDLYDIIDGVWFDTIMKSWTDSSRLERCAHQCGGHNTLTTQIYDHMRRNSGAI